MARKLNFVWSAWYTFRTLRSNKLPDRQKVAQKQNRRKTPPTTRDIIPTIAPMPDVNPIIFPTNVPMPDYAGIFTISSYILRLLNLS